METTCQIPRKITAGDTISWTDYDSDYPASIFTFKLVLISAAGKQSVTAEADGDNHLFTLDSTTTSVLKAGRYDYQLIAEGDGYRNTIDRGSIRVEANLESLDTFDGRDWLDISIEALQASIQKRADHVQLSHSFDGVEIQKMSQLDQMDLLDRLLRKRGARNRKKRLSKGLSPFATIKVGF